MREEEQQGRWDISQEEKAHILWQAWVELDSRDEMDRALDLHRKHLGSRFSLKP